MLGRVFCDISNSTFEEALEDCFLGPRGLFFAGILGRLDIGVNFFVDASRCTSRRCLRIFCCDTIWLPSLLLLLTVSGTYRFLRAPLPRLFGERRGLELLCGVRDSF